MSFVLVEIELLNKAKEFRVKAVTGLFKSPLEAVCQVVGPDSPLLTQINADGWRGFRFNDTCYYVEEIYHPTDAPEEVSWILPTRSDMC